MNATPHSSDTRAWFSQGVQQNMETLYGVALRLTDNQASAEDLVADTVVKAWSAIGMLEDRERFRAWLFRIMHNEFISQCRRRKVRPEEKGFTDMWPEAGDEEVINFLMEQGDDFLQWWANPEKAAVNRMLGEQIRAAIETLPEAFRTTILLVNVEGLTYDEAAETLGVPPGTIRSRMKRGRTVLQKLLWQQARDAGLTNATEKVEANS